jgi:hypothetical protein
MSTITAARPFSARSTRVGFTAGNVALWTLQLILAALFLFAGGMKLVVSIESMTQQMPVALPGGFIRFIGVVEGLGGLGLVLPMLTRIRPWLTPLAAAGLCVVMAGAVGFTLGAAVPGAIIPGVVGIAAAVVAFGRRELLSSGS